MKTEKMLEHMNLLDDKYILEAAPKGMIPVQKSKRKTNRMIRCGALAASFVLIMGVLLIVPYRRVNDPELPDETRAPYESVDSQYGSEDTQNNLGTDEPPVAGEHMGDELYSPYIGYVDGVVYRKGTFSENYAKYMGKFDETEGEWEYDRPAVMYYLTQEMELTREDLETYYAAVGYENVPEYVYEGLLTDSLEESMQLLKSDYAFYNNGKLYTVYDIYTSSKISSKNDFIDFTAEEYDQVWLDIDKYLDSPYAYDVGDNIRDFVDKIVDNIYVDKE